MEQQYYEYCADPDENILHFVRFLLGKPRKIVLFLFIYQMYDTYHESCDTFSMNSMVIGRRVSCI